MKLKLQIGCFEHKMPIGQVHEKYQYHLLGYVETLNGTLWLKNIVFIWLQIVITCHTLVIHHATYFYLVICPRLVVL